MKKFVRTLRENFIFLLMVLPGAAWLILFFYIPVFGNIVAFKDYHITGEGFIDSVMKSSGLVLTTSSSSLVPKMPTLLQETRYCTT